MAMMMRSCGAAGTGTSSALTASTGRGLRDTADSVLRLTLDRGRMPLERISPTTPRTTAVCAGVAADNGGTDSAAEYGECGSRDDLGVLNAEYTASLADDSDELLE